MTYEEGQWQDKVWGRTKLIDSRAKGLAVFELELKKDTYCSFHYHRSRKNRFLVFKGSVRVVWCIGTQLRYKDLSSDNFSLDIPSMVAHQFQVLEDGMMREFYFSDDEKSVDLDDIVRLSEGNKLGLGQSFGPHPEIYNKSGEVLDQRWITR